MTAEDPKVAYNYRYFREENILPLPVALEYRIARNPGRVAIIQETGSSFTYEELGRWSNLFSQIVGDLAAAGDRVALWLPNTPQFIFAYYGAAKARSINVPINYLTVTKELRTQPSETINPTKEIIAQLEDSQPKVIFVWDLFWPILEKIGGRLIEEAAIIIVGPNDLLPPPLNLLPSKIVYKIPEAEAWLKKNVLGRKIHHNPQPQSRIAIPTRRTNVHLLRNLIIFKKLQRLLGGREKEFSLCTLSDVAQLQYTGGTTGIPKGAMLTHRNLVANAWQSREHFADVLQEGETVLAALPFFHIYGLQICIITTLIALGGTLVLQPRFSPRGAAELIRKHRITLFPAATVMLDRIAELEKLGAEDLSSLRCVISGAAKLKNKTRTTLKRNFCVRYILEGYGLSETSPVLTVQLPGMEEPGYVGLPIPGTEIKLLDVNTGEEVAGGEGEIWAKGPQIMAGYWKNPKETASVLKDGWLRTGDVGVFDEHGLRITDRTKNMGKVNNENVYGAPIEEFLMQCPAVKHCAVIFVEHPMTGEAPIAFVVLDESLPKETFSAYIKNMPNRLWRLHKVIEIPEALFEQWTNQLGKVNHEKVKAYYRETGVA